MADSAIEINVDELLPMWVTDIPDEPNTDSPRDMESESYSPGYEDYDQGSPGNYMEASGELSRSEMILPRTPQLDATVLVISLAIEKGIDVERWLLVADTDENGESPRRSSDDEEEGTLIASEDFQSRILSLSMVVSTHEMDTTREEIELGVSPEALSMIEDFFGVSRDDIAVEDEDEDEDEDANNEDNDENLAMFVDVSYFLVYCFENMERVKDAHQERVMRESDRLQRLAKEAAGRARVLLQEQQQQQESPGPGRLRHDKGQALSPYRSPHSSPARSRSLPKASPVKSPKRSVATDAGADNVPPVVPLDVDQFIKELLDERAAARDSANQRKINEKVEKDGVGVTLTPTSVVSRRSHIERSPFDEEIAFELDEDDEEEDVTLGSDGLPLRKGKKDKRGRKGSSGSNVGKSSTAKKSKANSKAEANLLLDLVSDLVRHSDSYLRVRRRLAFVRSRDPTTVSNYVGPPRTSVLPKAFGDDKKKRLSVAEVQTGMLAGRLILTDSQVETLFQHVDFFAQHMRALYKQQEEMQVFEDIEKQKLPTVNVVTGELQFGDTASASRGSPCRTTSKSLIASYYGVPEEADLPPVPLSPRSRAKFQGPFLDDIASFKRGGSSPGRGRDISPPPPPAINLRSVPAGNGHGKSVTRVSASRDGTFRSSVSSLLSATLSTAHTQSAAFGGTEALTTVSVQVRCGDSVWRISIPSSNIKPVYKKKISSEWLDYYLQYLHKAHKSTVLQEISLYLHQPEEAKRFAWQQQVERVTGVSYTPESPDANYELSGAGASPDAVKGLEYDDSRPDKVVLPDALVKALTGQIHLSKVSDKHLDVLVTRHAKSIMSTVILVKELNIRLHRWVGNVDAAGDYEKSFRIAMRSATKKEVKGNSAASTANAGSSPSVGTANPTTPSVVTKSTTPATADSAGSGLLSTVTKKQLASRVKRLLLIAKREELIASERMSATITRELFWKYACYCRDNHRSVADEAVCGWDEWLIWRFENFSNTHKDVIAYKQAALDRLRKEKGKEALEDGMAAAVDEMILGSFGNTGFSALTNTTATLGSGNRANAISTDVAFGRGSNVNSVKSKSPAAVVKVIHIPQTQTLSSKNTLSVPTAPAAAAISRAKHEADAVYNRWCAAKDAERASKTAQQAEQDLNSISKQRRKRVQAKRAFTEWIEARKQQVYYVKDKATGKLRVKRLEKLAELPAKHPVEWNPFTADGGVKKDARKGSKGNGKKRGKDPRGEKPYAKPLGLGTTAARKARNRKAASEGGGVARSTSIPRIRNIVREEDEGGIELTETFKPQSKVDGKEENGIELTVLNSINTNLEGETINL